MHRRPNERAPADPVDSDEATHGDDSPRPSPIQICNWKLWAALAVTVIAVWAGALYMTGLPSQPLRVPPQVDLRHSPQQVSRSIERSRDAVHKNPHSAAAWGRFGMVLFAHEFHEAAAGCFRHAQQLDSRDYRWPYFTGLCITFTAPQEGLAEFQKSVRLRPDADFVRLRMVELAIDLNALELAETHLKDLLAREPQSARAALAAARISMKRGDLKRSRAWAHRSAQLDPNRRATYELLSRIAFQLGDVESAGGYREQMQQASRTDDWPDPLLEQVMRLRRDQNWGLLQAQRLLDEGRPREAAALLDELLSQFPESHDLRLELARTLLMMGNGTEAEKILDDGLRRDPNSARMHRLRGAILFGKGNKQGAAEAFRLAVRIKPDYAHAHFGLGECLVDLGDTATGLTHLKAAFALDPQLPGLKEAIERLRRTLPE